MTMFSRVFILCLLLALVLLTAQAKKKKNANATTPGRIIIFKAKTKPPTTKRPTSTGNGKPSIPSPTATCSKDNDQRLSKIVADAMETVLKRFKAEQQKQQPQVATTTTTGAKPKKPIKVGGLKTRIVTPPAPPKIPRIKSADVEKALKSAQNEFDATKKRDQVTAKKVVQKFNNEVDEFLSKLDTPKDSILDKLHENRRDARKLFQQWASLLKDLPQQERADLREELEKKIPDSYKEFLDISRFNSKKIRKAEVAEVRAENKLDKNVDTAIELTKLYKKGQKEGKNKKNKKQRRQGKGYKVPAGTKTVNIHVSLVGSDAKVSYN